MIVARALLFSMACVRIRCTGVGQIRLSLFLNGLFGVKSPPNPFGVFVTNYVDKVTEHVASVVAALYLCAGPEFYVLHAVTGWWAIRFVLPFLKDVRDTMLYILH